MQKLPGPVLPEATEEDVHVRDFIQKNYEPYDGDECFLGTNPDRVIKSSGVSCRALRKGA